MAQTKKEDVRNAILSAGFRLFSEKGYAMTSLLDISREAGISKANLYVYFSSKPQILYAIYDPWLRQRIQALEAQVRKLRSPRRRLLALLSALWQDIPAEQNSFVNNIIQAASSARSGDEHDATTLQWLESRIEQMLAIAIGPGRYASLRGARIAHILIMALDGFAIHRHLYPERLGIDDATLLVVAKLLEDGLEDG
ncbi:MAG: TetR/AcrR family transcriptional regulator [Lautropia sp.]